MKNFHPALLPAGMSDVLSPDAAFESQVLEKLNGIFSMYGYEKVKPPLIEFEESLLGSIGKAMEGQTFRIMDPISQRMMGVRADITPQIARIASTRLKKISRPLRLSYAGEVLRVKGSEIRPERQFSQVGAELIGIDNYAADAEVIIMAANALTSLGISNLSIDLGLPTLIPTICKELNIPKPIEEQLRTILNRRDINSIKSLANKLNAKTINIFSTLLEATGPLAKSIPVLRTLNIGKNAKHELEALMNVSTLVSETAPSLQLTLDPTENRGFEYHTGVTFTFFAKDVRGEIGAGGRYISEYDSSNSEISTGFTFFMNT